MIITVANHKGGVGKTALTAHLMFYAAEQGHTVLGIDLDAQANLTSTFMNRDFALVQPNATALFEANSVPPSPTPTDVENIALLPAHPTLSDIDKGSLKSLFAARDAIRSFSALYDLVIIDTAPAIGLRLNAALAASDRVIAPLLPEKYSIDGLATLLEEINTIRTQVNPSLETVEFIFNMVNATAKTHSAIISEILEAFPMKAEPLFRHIAVTDALSDRRPVWRKSTHAGAATEWKNACEALLS